jgi:DNA primase
VQQLIDSAEPLAEFVYAYLVKEHGTTLEGKNRIASELQEIISASADPMQRSLMVAHFSEMLGVPQTQFAQGVKTGKQSDQNKNRFDRPSMATLPRHQRQLVDFIIFYPEYLDELLTAGLQDVVTNESAQEIISLLTRMQENGMPAPDRLLSMLPEQSSERKYVTELLISGSQIIEEGENLLDMRDELLLWIESKKKQKDSGLLMEQINAAQEKGDHELLMKLLQQKQEMGKK